MPEGRGLSKVAEKGIRHGGGKPPPMPVIPDHLGTAAKMSAQGPERKDAPTKILLGAVEGSDLHVIQLQIALTKKDLEKTELRFELLEKDKKILELERHHILLKMKEQEEILAKKMKKHGIPDGWSFMREKDGTYVLGTQVEESSARQ